MNIKRAILCGALLWVLIFFEVSILMFGLNIDTSSTLYYLIHVVALAILTVIASFVYFTSKTGTKDGFILGILFLITGVVLDALITVPLFVKDYSFFFNIEMFGGYLEMIIVTTIVGTFKNRFVRTKK
ncbi:MAG: hypothetical protein V1802_01160 [Candidatus Aenigmatarchaeota archaeon]